MVRFTTGWSGSRSRLLRWQVIHEISRIGYVETSPTRCEGVKRYLWLREPRTRERGSPIFSILGGACFVFLFIIRLYEVAVEGENGIGPLHYAQLSVGLGFLCLGAGEILYARQRRLAVLLRISGLLVFLPLLYVLFAAQIYSSWGIWTAMLMLIFFALVLVWVLVVWVRRRLRGGVERDRG